MIRDIKLMLGIETNVSDKLLLLMVKDATQAVLDYCHINKLPDALKSVVRELVINNFKEQNGDNIASIKRGDTQISYTQTIGPGVLSDRQKNRLNAYRKFIVR